MRPAMNTLVPDHPVIDGAPAFGRYAGRLARFGWQGLQHPRGALWRQLHHKRWRYVGVADARCFIGVALVDLGWTATAFAYLFDREQGRLLADWSQDALPGLGGLQLQMDDALWTGRSAFRGLGAHLGLEARGETMRLRVALRDLRIEAELQLAGMAPPLLAIGPIDGGIAHATQKTSALAVRGFAEAGGRRFALDAAQASLDASDGLLARNTAWRWASAHAPTLGFNLQQGYFGTQENVLWLDGQPIGLGAAQFEFDAAQPLQPWRVRTDDGLLDLRFTPEGARGERRNLLIAASDYVQPVGRFDGLVRAAPDAPPREVVALAGVTEDHRSRW